MMTASSGTVLSGHTGSYLITVTNKGPNDAANLTLTTSVPASTVFQSIAAPAGWSCTTPATGGVGQISCTAAALSNGASVQFTVTNMVVCATPDGTSIPSSAGVTSTTRNPNSSAQNRDRKSTRLNSSHTVISYAVFCLKKKNMVTDHLAEDESYVNAELGK